MHWSVGAPMDGWTLVPAREASAVERSRALSPEAGAAAIGRLLPLGPSRTSDVVRSLRATVRWLDPGLVATPGLGPADWRGVVQRALGSGILLLLRRELRLVPALPQQLPPAAPILPDFVQQALALLPPTSAAARVAAAQAPAPTGPYVINVVDELGVPIDGIALDVTVAGQTRQVPADGGTATVQGLAPTGATVALSDLDAVRETMRPLWDQLGRAPLDGRIVPAPGVAVMFLGDPATNTVAAAVGQPVTISIQPRVILARLVGMFFDTDKTFLLPSAMHDGSIAGLKQLYADNPNSKLLVVGHADTAGTQAHNDVLSLDRADAIAAFLVDDVDGWLKWYGADVPYSKRWGAHEDHLMVAEMPDRDDLLAADDPIRRYQEVRGLAVDGIAGPQTRRSLIRDYMNLDGVSLPSDIDITTHGCGENFPADPTGDNTADLANRRVELFFFDGTLGIQPPPPGKNSKPASLEYPEWSGRASETIEFGAGATASALVGARISMRFANRKSFPKPTALPMLQQIAAAMVADPRFTLVLVGHADPTGTDDANFKVSRARAEATRAWLTGDRDFFLAQFKEQDPKTRWDWEEVQWMMYLAQGNGFAEPAYVGQADGFPGRRTLDALGNVQLATEDLAISYRADAPTLERLVDLYLAAIDPKPTLARVRIVGGGSWHPPVPFGPNGPDPGIAPDAPELRRVDAFLFTGQPNPPLGVFPTSRDGAPAVYNQWAAGVTNELTAPPLPFFVELIDPDGSVSLANQQAVLLRDDPDAGAAQIGGVSTSGTGTAQLAVAPGFYFVQVQVGQDTFVSSFLLDPDASCGAALTFELSGGLDQASAADVE
jgi:outer membrane protein OmpA-like peptidoglycan-associated protein